MRQSCNISLGSPQISTHVNVLAINAPSIETGLLHVFFGFSGYFLYSREDNNNKITGNWIVLKTQNTTPGS